MVRPAKNYLSVRTNEECNMSCSFCVRHGEPARTPLQTADFCLKLAEILSAAQYRMICLAGGETLLDMARLCNIVRTCREVSPDSTVQIHTNGTKVDAAFMNWVNGNRLRVELSVNAVSGGEKNLVEMLTAADDATAALAAIKGIERLTVRKVLEPGKAFALDVLFLHQVLEKRILVCLDHTALDRFTIRDAHGVAAELELLAAVAPDHADWFTFMEFSNHECDCSQADIIYVDGESCSIREALQVDEMVQGCGYLSKVMGAANYRMMAKIIDRFRRAE